MKIFRKRSAVKIILCAVAIIILATVLLFILNNYFYPLIPNEIRPTISWVSNLLLISLLVLSEFSQISGITIKEIFSKSDKAQIGSRNHVSSESRRLINNIQGLLYGEDEDLSRVLSRCIMLCGSLNLSGDYRTWLRYELEGYSFANNITNHQINGVEAVKWLEQWARYRMRDTFVKFQYVSEETGVHKIENLPMKNRFVPFPIDQITRIIKEYRNTDIGEMYYTLYDLDVTAFNELDDFVKQTMNTQLPRDLRIFIKISEFEDILNAVRGKILDLLEEAGKQI